jgi:serine/threonine protein kinase
MHLVVQNLDNWVTVTHSQFTWEQEALEFVRKCFPAHEPYQAWSNFEFTADDGSLNEVDLLVFTPQGFFLIEIKSRPGQLSGDQGTWIWDDGYRRVVSDNPLRLANTKAKRLKSLLEKQKACRNVKLPFLEALVFCSAPNLRCDLEGVARYRVCLRDEKSPQSKRPGIMGAILRRECPGLEPTPRTPHDRPLIKAIRVAMEEAGIRASQRSRKVGDYTLEKVLEQGVGYQDWEASHVKLERNKRRIRLYLVQPGATPEERATINRVASREYQILEALQHPNILRTYLLTDYESGPALIFEHEENAIRLDHYLAQGQFSADVRLGLIRQIADAVRFAHEEKAIHRGLCPQSVLVYPPKSGGNVIPQVKVFNWQVGYQERLSTSGNTPVVTATSHIDRWLEDSSTAYLAPEALSNPGLVGEYLDIFSLGCLAFHIFSGQAPASNGLDLSNKLRETKGLQISAVIDGVSENLQLLIQDSTHPEVKKRLGQIASVADFLSLLEEVERELTEPEQDYVQDPAQAKPDDILPGGFQVLRRLGQGGCSIAFLVGRQIQDEMQTYVIKIASDSEHNQRIAEEAEELKKLSHPGHPGIVEYCEQVEIGNRTAFLMRPVFVDKSKQLIETLGQRLRREGKLHLDLLQRFGEDLLLTLTYLDEQGVNHRDIKPDNIAVGQVGRGNRLHLVLFDFSLAKTPLDNIHSGTRGYLDPLLPLRKLPRWDLYAERYAAGITLYEMATGTLPEWGDGKTDPSYLNCEITIDSERFDANLRYGLSDFFSQAFARKLSDRFDNAEEMLRAWRECFEVLEDPSTTSDHETEEEWEANLREATLKTSVLNLGLSLRATNALDRINVLTVEDLLEVHYRKLSRLPGVGNQTRREISTVAKVLRRRLKTEANSEEEDANLSEKSEALQPVTGDESKLSVNLLSDRLRRSQPRGTSSAETVVNLLLGFTADSDTWATATTIANQLQLSSKQIDSLFGKLGNRWSKERGLTLLRKDMVDILQKQGGVMSDLELAKAILLARGAVLDEPERTRRSLGLVRASIEVEKSLIKPRFQMQRYGNRVLIALNQKLARYASELGAVADELANADPLLPPGRVIQRLREVEVPSGAEELPENRLLQLAAAASQSAEISSRQELYPREMSSIRALKLSQGALLGVQSLSVQQIHDRVYSRYAKITPLPKRPDLDRLLREAGLNLVWNSTANNGQGGYVSDNAEESSWSHTSSLQRRSTRSGSEIPSHPSQITPEEADARQFEERLQRSFQEGAFLVLMTRRERYENAIQELVNRFAVQLMDFEELFLETLQEVASQAGVNWDLVIQTDATPHQGDWDKLMLLVGRTLPLIEAKLLQATQTILLTYPGLLARYDQMTLLERLREQVGRAGGIQGLWVLVPNPNQAIVAGKTVPVIGPGQRAKIPESWLENQHRGRK